MRDALRLPGPLELVGEEPGGRVLRRLPGVEHEQQDVGEEGGVGTGESAARRPFAFDLSLCHFGVVASATWGSRSTCLLTKRQSISRAVQAEMTALPWGKGEIRRQGQRIAILAFGTLLYPALAAAEKLDATVANMRFAKPLDAELVAELAKTHDAIVTVEEGCTMGGAGSAVMEALAAAGIEKPVLALGLPDEYIQHGDPAKLLAL